MIKAVFGLTNRSVEGFVSSVFARLGYALSTPDHTLISRRAKTLAVKIPRRPRGQVGPGAPLHVVIDSTGLKVFGEGEWKVRQHGTGKRRTWRKVHVGVDAQSGEVLAVEMSSSDVQDADAVADLIAQIDAPIDQVSADGAYNKRKFYEVLKKRNIRGAIPPQDGAAHWEAGHPRNTTLDTIARDGVRRWAKDSGYTMRALAENAMYRIKTLTGSRLSARLPETHTAEIYARIACLNVITALGMPKSTRATDYA